MNDPIKLALPINTSVLYQLADAQVAQVFAELGGALPEGIAEAVTKVQNERKAQAAEAAATEIVNLIGVANNFLQNQASRKVELLNEISKIDEIGIAVKKAVGYGSNTSNYLPLCKLVGTSTPTGVKRELLSVPDGWTMPVSAPVAAAPTTAA